MTDKYYNILGVSKNASLTEIKQAYRKRAKELHPDVNKEENAHEQFILLTEAYEYLQNIKSGKAYQNTTGSRQKTRYRTYQDWAEQERERARERARYYARKRYEEFVNSDYYKSLMAINLILDHLAIVFVIVAILTVSIILLLTNNFTGLLGIAIVLAVTSPIWIRFYKKRPNLNFREFWYAIKHLAATRAFMIAALGFFNIFTFFRIVTNTLITLPEIVIIYLTAFLLCGIAVFSLAYFKKTYNKLMLFIGVGPGVVSMLFLVNFLFSENPSDETYRFQRHQEQVGNYRYRNPYSKYKGESSYIHLENNQYDQYILIRVFADFYELADANSITYTLEDGLLGYRVVKDYEFIMYYDD